jgi:DNA-binding LacI/PurR family transcriptional regulator
MTDQTQNRRPTIRDVAREAGVSHQTVSRVLNNHPKVAPETRAHVLQIVDKMGYERNLAAQMLTTQQSIMLYAPKLFMPDDELLAMSHGIPMVRRDYAIDSRLTWIGFDQQHASRTAVQHLIDLGHCQIAHITGSLEYINPRLRYDAYLKTLEENGLDPGPVYIGEYGSQSRDLKTGYDGICEFVKQGRKFTAVQFVNDRTAIGALSALWEHGLQVPEDVSIIGFDNNPIAPYLTPPLTTIAFDFDFQAQLGFQFLFEQINDPDTYRHHQHVLIADLVTRRSTCSMR